MTNDADGNGHRGDDLPDRMRRLFNRAKGSAGAPPGGPGAQAAAARERAALRAELHTAIDRVLDGAPAGTPPDRLKRDLDAAIAQVLHRRHEDRSLPSVPTRVDVPGGSQTPTQPVDRVMQRLDGAVQRTLGNARPGVDRGRAYLAEQLPRLVQRLTPILLEIAADEQRMRQVEESLVRMLKARMNEKTAQRVARLAVSAARAAASRRRRGS